MNWGTGYINPDDTMRRALGLGGAIRESTLYDRLATELDVEVTSYSAWDVVEALVDPLTDAMLEGRVLLDERPGAIAQQITRNLDAGEAADALVGFGWGRQRAEGRVDQLAGTLTRLLAERLTTKLSRMMRRWEHLGFFDYGGG